MSALAKPIAQEGAQVRFAKFGAPDVLEVVETGPAVPGPGEVRIRVEASSVQFTDTLIRRGLYPDLKGKPPFVPGYDVLGAIDALGEGVTAWRVGDRVADLCMIGGNARYVVRPADGLVAVPDQVDAAEAVTLVLSWLTAQQALFRTARLVAGERLLVIGGNGAVGRAAIQLASSAGVEVYATASATHHEDLVALGAKPLPREGWQSAVADAGGVDAVLDGIAADVRSTYGALRRGGRFVIIGFSGPAASGSLLAALPAILRLGVYWLWPDGREALFYSITSRRKAEPVEFAQDLGELFDRLASGELSPDVAERLTLSQVADAHARLEAGGLRGKLVLDPWS